MRFRQLRRFSLALATVLALVGAAPTTPATGRSDDELSVTTKDWIVRAPASLGTQADLELTAAGIQLCTDEIHKLVGHRPRSPSRFTWTYVIDDAGPQFSAATADGVTSWAHSDARLVADDARWFREQIVRSRICYGPHEVTHVLTADGWGTRWATEGLAQLTDYLYGDADWRCCSAPRPRHLSCTDRGYDWWQTFYPYSDLSSFEVTIEMYNTAACFWDEILVRGGLPAIRRALASIRVDPPATTGDLIVRNVNPAVGDDLRPIAARYGFTGDELAARPRPLAPVTPSCKAGTTADGDVVVGTIGRDTLRGTPGRDYVCGLAGRDRISGGPGADVLQGGAGRDLLLARDGRRDLVDCGPGPDTVSADRLDRVSQNCEKVRRARH